MTEWKLENNLLTLYIDGSAHNLSGSEIADLEEGKEMQISGQSVPRVTSQLAIDFSQSYYFSTIKCDVYTPATKGDMLPVCQFVVEDPFFISHEVPFLAKDYIVVDNMFLLISGPQAEELGKQFTSHASGPVGFRQIATLQKNLPQYVSFKESDDRCVKSALDSIDKSKTRSTLYSYQLQGVEWMDTVCGEDVGFVLADEMGLGKTVQIITLLDEQREHGPSLIIAPNSLLENWSREFKRFAPWVRTYVDAGKNREYNYNRLKRFDVVICSYDTARIDFSVFYSVDWNLIVLDEAQMIKNFGTQRSKEIRKFPKRCGVAVTGTPVENRLTDVWSIYDFCFPGLLGSVGQFKSEFPDTPDGAMELERVISPLLLRRKAKDVRGDLPQKVVVPIALEMLPEEAEGYERVRTEFIDEKGANPGLLMKLCQYCALPELEDPEMRTPYPADESAKFAYLYESVLDEIFSLKEKVIIFTRYKGAQEKIRESVKARYGAFCEIFNGSVAKEERQTIVDMFSEVTGFAVLIINPTVGGTGLNITAANHVVFYTLEWNPAIEDQCIARALRIGQGKTVFVYRLFYSDTVEDEVNDCLERKRVLQDAAVKGTTADIKPDINKALARSPFVGRS